MWHCNWHLHCDRINIQYIRIWSAWRWFQSISSPLESSSSLVINMNELMDSWRKHAQTHAGCAQSFIIPANNSPHILRWVLEKLCTAIILQMDARTNTSTHTSAPSSHLSTRLPREGAAVRACLGVFKSKRVSVVAKINVICGRAWTTWSHCWKCYWINPQEFLHLNMFVAFSICMC